MPTNTGIVWSIAMRAGEQTFAGPGHALILSEVLDELQKRGEVATIEAIKRVSPIAWQHINFYGRYLFDADFSPIDLDAIRQHLSSEEVRRFYAA